MLANIYYVDVDGFVGLSEFIESAPLPESEEQATIKNEDIQKMVEKIFLLITTP